MNDYEASVKKDEITDAHFTVAKPRHLDITADHAYVVVSANYTYKEKGKPMSEMGSVVTMSLQKVQAGWRITGWAWAQPLPSSWVDANLALIARCTAAEPAAAPIHDRRDHRPDIVVVVSVARLALISLFLLFKTHT